ncbi:peptidase domain-containing ABC transporter [Roseospira navarrensis]|uniref:ATP-binding cassette domain-containing protein n=1 Tax=Roseospira navarrensis TaxID=140058 RepID=A0A7X1ZGS1_9PROT|nr:peptidase domain-containing ABC transporter [Roseospira navarrensis]MQX38264.1 ATP-binding cassette domain-containing protein [Roseospira navarrensis]
MTRLSAAATPPPEAPESTAAAAAAAPPPEASAPHPAAGEGGSHWAARETDGLGLTRLTEDSLGGFTARSDLAVCLVPLLRALNWLGNPRHVAEALPHFAEDLDITGLRNTLAHLNYSSRPARLTLRTIDPRLVPCLFVPDRGAAMVVTAIEGRTVTAFDGGTQQDGPVRRTGRSGTAYFFTSLEPDDQRQTAQQQRIGWFNIMARRFNGLLARMLLITLVLNLLGLATPLFVMGVYDRVVGARALDTLGWFLLGAGIAILFDVLLRGLRARMLAYVGGRLDAIVGNGVFERILYLPSSFTERATIGAQVARIKDFESVREFFTGNLANTFLELPFVLIYVLVMALLGGWIAVVPLVAMVVLAVVGLVLAPMVRAAVAESARAGSRRQEFLVEATTKMRALKQIGAEDLWLSRFRSISARAAMASFHTAQIQNLVQTAAHVVTVFSGVAAMTLGVNAVLAGTMTPGALIACMILVWRVLAPLQTVATSLSRFEQIRASIRQINTLMTLALERDPKAMIQPLRRLRGRVELSRVSLRYAPGADPAMVGVSFVAEPGEVLVITGPNASGKSTIVKLIAGLYRMQAGALRIDGKDIRQIDPIELRHAIAYVPQQATFFYGTIAQNLRLVEPTASDADIRWALAEAGALEEVLSLPEGLETRIGDGRAEQLNGSLRQQLNLARAYLKRAAIYLFDEPVNGLDFESDQRFMETVRRIRGHATVFIITHRPSHFALADKLLVMESGYLRMIGPPDEVRPHIQMDRI